jgi:hypothetical protein
MAATQLLGNSFIPLSNVGYINLLEIYKHGNGKGIGI